MATSATDTGRSRQSNFLDAVERFGNALPDPVAIFVFMIGVLVAVSVVGASQGWTATNPVTGDVLVAQSLLSEPLVRQLLTEMPKTLTGFTPLGYALLLVMGAGVAEGSGLFAVLLRRAIRVVPDLLLTPAVILLGMLTTHAIDAGYIVYIPLAGIAFASAGRNPALGIVLGYIGCSVGLAANLMPGQYDVLMFGITQTGARLVAPDWEMNPLGNWWFIVAIAMAFVSIGWLITARIVGPRFGDWQPGPETPIYEHGEPSTAERKALRAAGLVALAVIATFAALVLWPGYRPLYDETAEPGQRIVPFYRSLAAGLFFLFLMCGWAFGKVSGSIPSHREAIAMMGKGLEALAPYLVMVFFAAHFVAMFGWSNLGPILAIHGAAELRALNAPPALLLPLLTTASAWLDFLIASGSAKWTAMAPVAVPMLMLLEVSPEMTTAAYRVGDTVTNLISPLNPYFVLTLLFCRRWMPSMRLGTLLSATLPYAIAFYIAGAAIIITWVALDIPPGPGSTVGYHIPAAELHH